MGIQHIIHPILMVLAICEATIVDMFSFLELLYSKYVGYIIIRMHCFDSAHTNIAFSGCRGEGVQ